LDVLSGLEEVGIVTGYRRSDGSTADVSALGDPGIEPEVTMYPGWSEDIREVRAIKDLPAAARAYLDAVANVTGVPISLVSVGPERSAYAV
jgi:adenylosuccinate synthase